MFLGIDLSCYTTSCAVADENGKIIYDDESCSMFRRESAA